MKNRWNKNDFNSVGESPASIGGGLLQFRSVAGGNPRLSRSLRRIAGAASGRALRAQPRRVKNAEAFLKGKSVWKKVWLSMVVASALLAAGTGNVKAATGTCDTCGGMTDIEVMNWPTCYQEGYADAYCLNEACPDYMCPSPYYLPRMSHEEGDWVIVREASCIDAGEKSRYCTMCGIELDCASIDTSYSKHSYGSWSTIRTATCTTPGLETGTCQYCGTKTERETSLADHQWDEWRWVDEKSCITAGTRAHTCKVCGKTDTENKLPDRTLKKGDNSENVKKLQTILNQLGYDCGTADGAYGNKTETAIKAVQKSLGIPEDGIAYPGIRRLLAEGNSACVLDLTVDICTEATGELKAGDTITITYDLVNDGQADLTDIRVDLVGLKDEKFILKANGKPAWDFNVLELKDGMKAGAEEQGTYTWTLTADNLAEEGFDLVLTASGYDKSKKITMYSLPIHCTIRQPEEVAEPETEEQPTEIEEQPEREAEKTEETSEIKKTGIGGRTNDKVK